MSYFTTRQGFFLYSFDFDVKEIEKLNSFLRLLDDSGVKKIIDESMKKMNYQGRNHTNPYNMLATVLYSFAMSKGTLRDIERSCKLNLDYIYLMNNERPSYVTFSTFINEIIVPNSFEIMKLINIQIIKEMGIDISDVFIDGTKFEANANKYKFVWKPTNKQIKLTDKIKDVLHEYNIVDKDKIISSIKIANYLSTIKSTILTLGEDLTDIPFGKGKRKSKHQKLYQTLQTYLQKQLEYEEQVILCGDNRNSYYKTDIDATAMCLKEDYYSGLGSNMHAAYNVQFVVSKGLILECFVSQDRNDYLTLIPVLKKYNELYGSFPKNVCADSGYGSHVNYKFINDNNIGNFIKYSSWEKERNGKNPQLFYVINNQVFCLNNKMGTIISIPNRHPKSSESNFFRFTGCRKCIYKLICKKNIKRKTDSFRIAEINPLFLLEIQQARENLLSPKGIEIRVNRSIQVEGDIGIIKQNQSFTRFRRRGINYVLTEIILTSLGVNIKKYLRFISSGYIPSFWVAPDNLQPEIQKPIKVKLSKPSYKSKNKINKMEYKYKSKKTAKS